jgi:hypothetical protein
MGTNPFALTDQTKNLNDRFYLLLNKIVNSYPSTKINPNDSMNNTIYATNMAKMEDLQNEYFLYKNSVVQASEAIQNAITDGNNEVNALEAQNKVLRIQFENLKTSSYSAEGLFDDAQISRNQLWVSNFILFGIMAGGGYMYYKSTKQV